MKNGLISSLVVLLVFVSFGFICICNEAQKLFIENKYYKSIYLSESGMVTDFNTGKVINYNICSFDKGAHWYCIEREDNGFKIIGDVKLLYPNLIELIDNWKKLCSITNDAARIEVLKNIGFVLTTNNTLK